MPFGAQTKQIESTYAVRFYDNVDLPRVSISHDKLVTDRKQHTLPHILLSPSTTISSTAKYTQNVQRRQSIDTERKNPGPAKRETTETGKTETPLQYLVIVRKQWLRHS